MTIVVRPRKASKILIKADQHGFHANSNESGFKTEFKMSPSLQPNHFVLSTSFALSLLSPLLLSAFLPLSLSLSPELCLSFLSLLSLSHHSKWEREKRANIAHPNESTTKNRLGHKMKLDEQLIYVCYPILSSSSFLFCILFFFLHS